MERDGAVHEALLAATYRIARPLVRVCLIVGLPLAKFRAVIDLAVAHEAERHERDSGKRHTLRSVARVSGISRGRIAALRDTEAPHTPLQLSAKACAAKVIAAWRENAVRDEHEAASSVLSVTGQRQSLAVLVRKHSHGVDQQSVLRELLAAGLIEVTERDRTGDPAMIQPTDAAVPSDFEIATAVDELGSVCGDAAEMIEGNLLTKVELQKTRVYRVTATVLAPRLRLIRRKLRERAETFASSIDELLEAHDLEPDDSRSVLAEDPESLQAVRVTLISTIRPARRADTAVHAQRPTPTTDYTVKDAHDIP